MLTQPMSDRRGCFLHKQNRGASELLMNNTETEQASKTEVVKMVDLGRFHASSEVFWRENVHGGCATLLALLIVLAWHCFKGLVYKKASPLSSSSTVGVSDSNPIASGSGGSQLRVSEMVTDADLKFLIENLDEKIGQNEKWENVIEKGNDLMYYSAKCCKPKVGPVKYLSTTIFEDCPPEILRDFYMDNDYRKQWDKMLIEHEQLHVDKNNGVEVGRTIKKFPLLTPREYVLAWRLWEGKDKTFYCFVKECEHPLAPKQKKYVRVSTFRSGWRIRKVPGRNACEIKMYHQEDAGLNVKMAKLAFAKGIWSYVCKMDSALRKYSTISNDQSSSATTAVTLMKKVPPGLEAMDSNGATSAEPIVHRSITGGERKLSRRPSKKLLANGLLLLGGVVCLSRGHSSLGAKVAMAYILTKLKKRGASSSQNGDIAGI